MNARHCKQQNRASLRKGEWEMTSALNTHCKDFMANKVCLFAIIPAWQSFIYLFVSLFVLLTFYKF